MAVEQQTEETHRCSICGQTFGSREELKQHVDDLDVVW